MSVTVVRHVSSLDGRRAAVAPDRTAVQRLDALAVGNAIRSRRATLKIDIAAGRTSVADILADPPEWCASMRVVDLLMAGRGWGTVKSLRILHRTGIASVRTVGGLTVRQRTILVAGLQARGVR